VSAPAWTFLCGRIAVAETRLLTNDEFLDLLRLPAVSAFVQRVRQVETYVELPSPDDGSRASRVIEEEYVRIVRRQALDSPDVSVAEAMLVSYAFAELRAFVRARALKQEPAARSYAFFTEAELDVLWNGSFPAWPELEETAAPEFAEAVAGLRRTLSDCDSPAAVLDLALDRAELVHFLARAERISSDFIRRWAREYVRLRAALAVIRARLLGEETETLERVFLAPPLGDEWLETLAAADPARLDAALAKEFTAPDGSTVEVSRASIGKVARLMDDHLTMKAREARMIIFGPERLFAYLWALHVENLNLRLVAETIAVEADRDLTRRRLRMSYV
jgi:vacuolar-type H+-ATPase subunit C/Vma6